MKQLEKTAEKYALECQREEGYPSPTYDSYDAKEMRECAFMAGAQWQVKQSLWISVSERLPMVNTIVLTKGAYGYLICFLSTFGEWETGAHVNEEKLGVTHWMPIPKFNE